MSANRHYSGVLVHVDPPRFEPTVAMLEAIAGLELHHTDPPTGRCVVVLDTADRAGQEALFERIRAVSGVRGVELVYHLIEPRPAPAERQEGSS